MNRILKKILLLCSPLLIILVFAELRLRNIKTVYERKKEDLEKIISETDVLVLGNSHGENAIIPAMLSDHGYNLSLPSQSLFYNEKIFEKYLPQLSRLKTLIITVDYHSLYYIDFELTAFNNGKAFGVSNRRYDYRFTGENLSYFFFVYGALPSVGYLLKKPNPATFENGYEPRPSGDSGIINFREGFLRASLHNKITRSENAYTESEVSLTRMIMLAQRKGIDVIMLSTPVFRTYYDNLEKNIEFKNEKIYARISEKYKIPYLNFMNDQKFVQEDFSDNDHLSIKGARKLTALLKPYISKN